MTASEWWDATAVRETGDGWVGEIDPGWNIGRNPNGGYTLALMARAMLEASGRPDPLTVTAHYVAPPQVGEVRVKVETVRAGRRYATLSADMTQGDKDLIRVIGAFGDLETLQGPTRVAAAPPPRPPRCPARRTPRWPRRVSRAGRSGWRSDRRRKPPRRRRRTRCASG